MEEQSLSRKTEMTKNDLLDLNRLIECEIIKFQLNDDVFSLLVVGDNEEDEIHDHHDDEEDDDCCEGLNGHLFKLEFKDVKNYSYTGEECDNYLTKRIIVEDNHLSISLEGVNFIEGGSSSIKFSFNYSSFTIKDMGPIAGPDA